MDILYSLREVVAMESVVPGVPITLDRVRHLRLDIQALIRAERDMSDLWGKKTSVYGVLLDVPIGINDLCILVHRGLQWEDPTLNFPQVQELLNRATMTTIFQAVTDAWTKATRAAESSATEEVAPADPWPTLSTGGSSGPMPASISG
jgi:hypothetical protein